jgi:hypothetical protein
MEMTKSMLKTSAYLWLALLGSNICYQHRNSIRDIMLLLTLSLLTTAILSPFSVILSHLLLSSTYLVSLSDMLPVGFCVLSTGHSDLQNRYLLLGGVAQRKIR